MNTVRYLLGQKTQTEDISNTLVWATTNDRKSILKDLIEKAKPTPSDMGRALLAAVNTGNPDLVIYFIRLGVETSYIGMALIRAAAERDTKIARWLLANRKQELTEQNINDAINAATVKKQQDMIELLESFNRSTAKVNFESENDSS